MTKREKIDFKKQGKKNRTKGIAFEARVREDLTKMGWTVDKWLNTVEMSKDKQGQLVPAKRKYNPFKKVMVIGTGFPDFIAFKKIQRKKIPKTEEEYFQNIYEKSKIQSKNSNNDVETFFEVIGVEVKSNGYLDQEEKGMCLWLLKNKIFSRILIAKKKKDQRKIQVEYDDFKEKYGHKFKEISFQEQ